jgi:hypothetical protein
MASNVQFIRLCWILDHDTADPKSVREIVEENPVYVTAFSRLWLLVTVAIFSILLQTSIGTTKHEFEE